MRTPLPAAIARVALGITRLAPVTALGLGLGLAGCHGELRELLDSGGMVASDAALTDGAAGTTGPSDYVSTIQADLDALGCTAPQCHGTREPMVASAFAHDAATLARNYAAVKARASAGAMSLLLVKTLAGSGTDHTGGKPFATTDDAVYRRWLAWIAAGAPFVSDGGTP